MTRSRAWLAVAVVGVVALMFLVAILTTTEQSGGVDTDVFGDPTVTGEALPDAVAGNDQTAGQLAPTFSGENFAGEPVAVEADGRPKMLVFLAHWCEFCQQELPEVEQWAAEGNVPEGVDLVGVATGIDPGRPNFPPSEWFEREGWSSPVVVDDGDNSIGEAYGLTAYPFWTFLDDEHQVVSRLSGNLTTDQLDAIAEGLVAGEATREGVDGGDSSDADG